MLNENIAAVREHYERPGDDTSLIRKISALLDALPQTPLRAAALAGLDQFHAGGLASTVQLAALAGIGPAMDVLDAGAGLGGPSRYLAETYGCTVDGVDIAPSFVEVAQLLAQRTGLAERVRYRVGDLAALPYADERFDLVWTQHVVMNVADRDRTYGEFARVLKPAGRLAFFDILAADDARAPFFPLPWAERPATSFLLTKAATLAALERAGFAIDSWTDVTADVPLWLAQQQAAGASQPLSLSAVMGPRIAEMSANIVRNVADDRLRLAMGICRRVRAA